MQNKVPEVEKALQDYLNKTGCTDPTAINYDPKALIDNNSCIRKV